MEQETLEHSIKIHGIEDYFSIIMGMDNHHAHGKLDNAKLILSEIKAATHETLLIGDTIHDYEVADAIGCPYLLIGSGHQSFGRLSANDRRTAVDHMTLLTLLTPLTPKTP